MRVGLIVNPIAGMGGRVGLKGTDGASILRRATELGAEPVSHARTVLALKACATLLKGVRVLTCSGEMGESEVREAGIEPEVIVRVPDGKTTPADTIRAAQQMLKDNVDLILFAGGDGTARDICTAVDMKVPVLGIPAGVKIHSSVFAVNPVGAGQLVAMFVSGKTVICEAEVMDIDEDAFRADRVSAKLYGYLKVPHARKLVQPAKAGSSTQPDERMQQEAIAEYFLQSMDDSFYILGPGTTIRAIGDILGIDKTVLGVDVVQKGKMLGKDLTERQLLEYVDKGKTKIVVTPIGGQGFIFGRGNQQISAQVIRKVGRENIVVVATPNKLLSIGIGEPLLVDSGDPEVDSMLLGHMRVITGFNEEAILRIGSR